MLVRLLSANAGKSGASRQQRRRSASMSSGSISGPSPVHRWNHKRRDLARAFCNLTGLLRNLSCALWPPAVLRLRHSIASSKWLI